MALTAARGAHPLPLKSGQPLPMGPDASSHGSRACASLCSEDDQFCVGHRDLIEDDDMFIKIFRMLDQCYMKEVCADGT